MNYPKRLIEVDLPISRISAHARADKSVRHGHISTLHIWWARRPLAACRAVACATLWPDPADPTCPGAFLQAASEQIVSFARRAWTDLDLLENSSDAAKARWQALADPRRRLDLKKEKDRLELRLALFDFIADFASWKNSSSELYFVTARNLTQAAHASLTGSDGGDRPLVLDPFAGGGAIPLEALHVGARSFCGDLNPLSVLLNKLQLRLIPAAAPGLGTRVREEAARIAARARKRIGHLYPSPSKSVTPIAYLWARTIRCEGPSCGAELPLIGNTRLASGQKPRGLALNADQGSKKVNILIQGKAGQAIYRGKKATCPVPGCAFTTSGKSIRKQLSARRGGSSDARLIAVVETTAGATGREYRAPNRADLAAIEEARVALAELRKRCPDLIPTEGTTNVGGAGAARAFSQRQYGMDSFETLYTPRQLLALATFADEVRSLNVEPVLKALMACALGRLSDLASSLCRWVPSGQFVASANGGQNRMPVLLDFAEANPLGGAGGDWEGQADWIARVVDRLQGLSLGCGEVEQRAAQEPLLPPDTADVVFTDPPYYDAFPYSHLADHFLVWGRRALGDQAFVGIEGGLSPKDQEIVVYDVPHGRKGVLKDAAFFEAEMKCALEVARSACKPDGLGVVVFANKTSQGWEALLSALLGAGWIVVASWPLDTERPNRQRALGSAALGSSVHIVVRPREQADGSVREDVGDWRDVLQELPKKVHAWLPRLALEGVVGADAIFACLGPALEVFSRYSRVERASGDAVSLREYLEHVWAAVANEALSVIFREVDAGGLEPDGRLTAMWLWTLGAAETGPKAEADGDEEGEGEDEGEGDGDEAEKPKGKAKAGYTLEYDAARKIAQGLGADLELLPSVVELAADKARLLPVAERAQYLFAVRRSEGGKEPGKAKAKKGKKAEAVQTELFDGVDAVAKATDDAGGSLPAPGKTVLDRLHQVMLLFAAGRNEAVRRFLVDEGAGRDARLWKLAQSLSALYPNGSDERRWVEGVLARKKGLGL